MGFYIINCLHTQPLTGIYEHIQSQSMLIHKHTIHMHTAHFSLHFYVLNFNSFIFFCSQFGFSDAQQLLFAHCDFSKAFLCCSCCSFTLCYWHKICSVVCCYIFLSLIFGPLANIQAVRCMICVNLNYIHLIDLFNLW